MGDPLFILAVLALAAVVIVLIIGIGGFGQGGAFNQKFGNKMMRLRLLLQFVAVVLVLAVIYFRGQGGQ